jgi:hypothetical protein
MEVLTCVACYNINTKYPIYANVRGDPSSLYDVNMNILYLKHNIYINYNSMDYLLYIFAKSVLYTKYVNYNVNKYLIYLHHDEQTNEVFLPDNIVYLCMHGSPVNFDKMHNLQYYKPIYYIYHKINVLYLVCIKLNELNFHMNIIGQYLKYIKVTVSNNYTILPDIYRTISAIHPELKDAIQNLDNCIKNLPYRLKVDSQSDFV